MIRVLLLLLAWVVPAGAGELKLASWNIAWLTTRAAGDPALPRGLAVRGEEDFARLARYAERLAADVVALQEVDGPEAAARVFDPRRWEFHFADEGDVQRAGFAWRRGLRVVRNPDLAALDLRPEARRSLRRGADITVMAEGAALRLLSVHLDSGCLYGALAAPERRDCESLGQQASVLAGWIAARQAEGAAFGILGDFNRRIAPGDEFMAVLEQAAPLLRATAGFSDPCWDSRYPRFITHILLGGAARDWLVAGSLRVMVYAEREERMRALLSDHCPVSVRVRLP